MNEFREVIQKVSRGEKLAKDLTREEARQALRWIFDGEASEFQIGAFFSAMRMKGESAEETVGLVEAVRERATQLYPKLEGVVDFGEPYDGKVRTLHLTIPMALILSAAGVPVVLHSAKNTPVKKGIETQGILEALGVEIIGQGRGVPCGRPEWHDKGQAQGPPLQEILEKENITFLPTEKLVPDFAKLRPYREAFGLRPFTNHIEKIFNLANASTPFVGVYHRPYLEPMGEALAQLGTQRIFIIQGVEGFTEFFISRKTLVLHRERGETETLWLDPAEFGFQGEEEPALRKTAEEHAERIKRLLEGEQGPARRSLIWNTGVKLFWMKKSKNIEEGLTRAEEILDSGKAKAKLEAFRHATQEKTGSEKI